MKKPFELACNVFPSERQIKWQQTEFYALISYGLAVFTGKQYGNGFTPASVFWPEDTDVDSWCQTVKSAGMKGIVFTCKHYDGFCLWPTAYTDYSVKSSNWEDGNGDFVKLVSDACKKYDLKFGIYISPWDRHEKSYGSGKEYDDIFCGMLEELLTSYGDIFCVWLDGIIGSEENRVQNYDWGRYYSLIRKLSPDSVISFMGPDVRWSGNEKGFTRKNEWSSIPSYIGILENGCEVTPNKKEILNLSSPDLGSRKAIKYSENFIWYPCEVAVPMRSHWFFEEDDKYSIKTKDKLLKLYYNTVGSNSALMLGLSPNKRGVLDETDTQILNSLGYDLKINFGYNLLKKAAVSFSSETNSSDLTVNSLEKSWRPKEEDKKPEILIEFEDDQLFDKIVIGENIRTGQHVEEFSIMLLNEKGKWKTVFEGECIGYKKICCITPVKSKKIKISFTEFRENIDIDYLQIN